MAQGLDTSMVREHYARLTDSELQHLLVNDGRGLTPEALNVAQEEAAKRGFGAEFLQAIKDQNRSLSVSEIGELCEAIQGLNCPHCGGAGGRLNATIAMQVLSFLVVTNHRKTLIIGCAGGIL